MSKVFTTLDIARWGYKILIILYDKLGDGVPTSAESILWETFRDEYADHKDDYYFVYDLSLGTCHFGDIIITNMLDGVSPIILDNVDDLTSVKSFCEEAVKNDYLIEIIQAVDVPSSITNLGDMFMDFGLYYKQEIPKLRSFPPIPLYVQREDNRNILQFIQDKYATLMDKNVKALIGKDANQEEKEYELIKGKYEKEVFEGFRKSLEEDINKKFEEIKDMTTKILNEYFEDIKMFTGNQSTVMSDNIDYINKKYEINNSILMRRIEDLLKGIKSIVADQTDILTKLLDLELTAFKKSNQDDINKRLDENNKMIMKKIETVMKEMRIPTENQNEILSTCTEEEAKASTVSPLDNRNLEESIEVITEDLLNVSIETITCDDKPLNIDLPQSNQENILVERVEDDIVGSFLKPTEEEIKKQLEEARNAEIKSLRDEIAEIKRYTEKERKILLESIKYLALNTPPSSSDKVTKVEQIVRAELADEDVNINIHGANKLPVKPQILESEDTAYERLVSYLRDGFKIMILMRGLPGSGKTYLANKLLKESLGIADTSEYIFDPFKEVPRTELFKEGENSFMYTTRKCLEAIKIGMSPVIVDSNNLQIEDMRVYCVVANQNCYMIEMLEVNTPWALDVPVLAQKNILKIDAERIQGMLKSYQRNISLSTLLTELNINYNATASQTFWKPIPKPKENTTDVAKK